MQQQDRLASVPGGCPGLGEQLAFLAADPVLAGDDGGRHDVFLIVAGTHGRALARSMPTMGPGTKETLRLPGDDDDSRPGLSRAVLTPGPVAFF